MYTILYKSKIKKEEEFIIKNRSRFFSISNKRHIFAVRNNHYTIVYQNVNNNNNKVYTEMKKGIHPENYRPVVFKDMSNGDMFLSLSLIHI